MAKNPIAKDLRSSKYKPRVVQPKKPKKPTKQQILKETE